MPIEVDRKPGPGAIASTDEFIRARSLIMDIHEAARWSPWAQEDRAGEYEGAMAIFGQWARPEPEFRQKTDEEHEAEHEQWLAGLEMPASAGPLARAGSSADGLASDEGEAAGAYPGWRVSLASGWRYGHRAAPGEQRITRTLLSVLPLACVMVVGPQIISAIFLATSPGWTRDSAA